MKKGERIVNLRERRGLSQTELAEKIGASKQTMYKYENDIVTNIPSDMVEKIADALNTTPAYIMGWSTEPSREEMALQRIIAYYKDFSEIQKAKLMSYAEGLAEKGA